MKHPEFIQKIDWKLLREQKSVLLGIILTFGGLPLTNKDEYLMGIVHLIDAVQDYSIDEMGLSDKEVFNLTPEEE